MSGDKLLDLRVIGISRPSFPSPVVDIRNFKKMCVCALCVCVRMWMKGECSKDRINSTGLCLGGKYSRNLNILVRKDDKKQWRW